MTSKELEAEMETARKDILRLKTEFYSLRDGFDKLAQEYEASKQHNPTQRYQVLKELIKTATKDVR